MVDRRLKRIVPTKLAMQRFYLYSAHANKSLLHFADEIRKIDTEIMLPVTNKEAIEEPTEVFPDGINKVAIKELSGDL